MAGEWRDKTLAELVELYRETVNPAERPDEVFQHYSIPAYDADQRPTIERGSEIGSIKFAVQGEAILVSKLNPRFPRIWHVKPDERLPAIASTEFLVLKARQGTDMHFIKYLFLSPIVRTELQARATGTSGSHQRVKSRDVLDIRVPLPPLPEQRAIAHILGTLDDKIELNRRMSQTLEAMARALFKSWFVDFEPVRAKMEGRWQRGNPLPPLPEGEGRGEGSLPTKSHAMLPSDLLAIARELRQNQTDAERLLWRLLRNRSLAGAKFLRQHPFPPYVLDFYCHELKLAIELDGGQHNLPEGRLHDKVRTAKLAEHGIRVLRFWNHEVLRDTESVLEAIYQAIVERREELRPSPPAPLPAGEGSMVSGLPAHLYDLFPDRLVDSELGEIPEGWEVVSVYEVADVIYGAPFSSAHFNTEGVGEPLLRIRDLPSESPGVWTTEVHPKGYKVRPGDIVVGMDGEFRAYLWGGVEAWLNQRLCVFKPKAHCSTAFVRNAIIQPLADVEATETATTVIHLGKADIDQFRVVLPTPDVAGYFNTVCQRWYDRIVTSKQQSRTLAALRDALLPKLIRGEIRVKDVERFLGRAM